MAVYPYTTQRWQRLRRQKLQRHPLCEACLRVGRIEPAAAVDHRTPISAGGDPFPPLDGLASLCISCHSSKTAANSAGIGTGGRKDATCSDIRSIHGILGTDLTIRLPRIGVGVTAGACFSLKTPPGQFRDSRALQDALSATSA